MCRQALMAFVFSRVSSVEVKRTDEDRSIARAPPRARKRMRRMLSIVKAASPEAGCARNAEHRAIHSKSAADLQALAGIIPGIPEIDAVELNRAQVAFLVAFCFRGSRHQLACYMICFS